MNFLQVLIQKNVLRLTGDSTLSLGVQESEWGAVMDCRPVHGVFTQTNDENKNYECTFYQPHNNKDTAVILMFLMFL